MAQKLPAILEENSMLRLFYIIYREQKMTFSRIMNFYTIEVEKISAVVMQKKLEAFVNLGLLKKTGKDAKAAYSIDWNGVVGHLFHQHFNRQKQKKYDASLVDYIRKHFLAYIHFGHEDTGTLQDAFIDVKESLHALKNFERIVKINEER